MDINSVVDTGSVYKNTENFSFVDSIGSFINNRQYRSGFDKFKNGVSDADSYIWDAVSAIGTDVADAIYENVLNYIDNVANVDLCRITALKSMTQMLGADCQIVADVSDIPLEIMNFMDVMSVNRKYLIDSRRFSDSFRNYISTEMISNSNSNCYAKQNGESLGLSVDGRYIDEDVFYCFLSASYEHILNKYVNMRYSEHEVGFSQDEHYEFIYQYIIENLYTEMNPQDSSKLVYTQHEREIREIKTRNKVPISFDVERIVDDIENGEDSQDDYSQFEQNVISAEIEYRNGIHGNYYHQKNARNDALAMKLARYSYYRERKVRDYFKFIEQQYSNMLIQENAMRSVMVEDPQIKMYEFDDGYFDIDQPQTINLVKKIDNVYEIQTGVVQTVAQILAEKTLAIARLREDLKIQTQKNSIKGTFLLLSYMINEYLKHNIAEKYSQQDIPLATDENLDRIILSSINTGENVELVEYYDTTEYFNIKQNTSRVALNGLDVNAKFWNDQFGVIGDSTKDLPFDDISRFYMERLKGSDKIGPGNLNEFLSVVFEYGANNSYIDRNSGLFRYQNSNRNFVGMDSAQTSAEVDDVKTHFGYFRKYIGQPIGTDQIYNFKNTTHPSYQIHPYLYNFIETANYDYAVANSYYNIIQEQYAEQLVKDGVDNIVGEYGQVLDIWATNSYDYSGYMTRYEAADHSAVGNSRVKNPCAGYDGLFYPPALEELAVSETRFYQDMVQNTADSYYYPLNLSQEELSRYKNLLQSVNARITGFKTGSTAYDIVKYALDVYGNSVMLVKPRSDYGANTNLTVRQTTGELWFKPKDHPFAFPMSEFYKAAYGNSLSNAYFNGHFDRIYDFELDPSKRCILAAVSTYKNSDGNQRDVLADYVRYDNVSILAAEFKQQYDQSSLTTKYTLDKCYVGQNALDDIQNPYGVYTANDSEYGSFRGFTQYGQFLNMVFLKSKRTSTSTNILLDGKIQVAVQRFQYQKEQFTVSCEVPQTEMFRHNNNSNDFLLANDEEEFALAYLFSDSESTALDPGSNIITYPHTENQTGGKGLSSYLTGRFTNYIGTYSFSLSKSDVRYIDGSRRLYNLNADIGYIPLMSTQNGKTQLEDHAIMKYKPDCGFQLFGPENNAEVDIQAPASDEDYVEMGRVVEEYERFNTIQYHIGRSNLFWANRTALTGYLSCSLSDKKMDTAHLEDYQYILYNSNYMINPISQGFLSALTASYTACSRYSTSTPTGDTMVGPGRGNSSSNIYNINSLSVKYDKTGSALCFQMKKSGTNLAGSNIDQTGLMNDNQFTFILYKFNDAVYEYYRLFENPFSTDTAVTSLTADLTSNNVSDLTVFNSDPSPLAFKYSEEDPITTKFPYINRHAYHGIDEVTVDLTGNNFLFSLDDVSTIDSRIINIDRRTNSSDGHDLYTVNMMDSNVKIFLDDQLTISCYYDTVGDDHMLYFNMNAYKTRPYIDKYEFGESGWPVYSYGLIPNTYLKLRPGESGRLDIRIEFNDYKTVNYVQHLAAHYAETIAQYYIINTSDSHPKFVISRIPLEDM